MEENNQNTGNTPVQNVVENNVVESTNIENNVVEITEVKKPYEFRKLNAKDMPLMIKIITKIKINRLADLLQNKDILKMFDNKEEENKEEENQEEENKKEEENKENNNFLVVGGTLILEAAQIVLEGLGDCEEIFEMLSKTSNLSRDEVEALDMDVLLEMIMDFIKKEEFGGFFKAVLKFIK